MSPMYSFGNSASPNPSASHSDTEKSPVAVGKESTPDPKVTPPSPVATQVTITVKLNVLSGKSMTVECSRYSQ